MEYHPLMVETLKNGSYLRGDGRWPQSDEISTWLNNVIKIILALTFHHEGVSVLRNNEAKPTYL